MQEKLIIGMEIYEEQPRWFEFEYHPQIIQKINEDTIEVFEEGFSPNGKYFTIPIKNLREKKFENDEICIIH